MMKPENPMGDFDISFITVNFRTPQLVDGLISSIRKNPPPASFEIIVVDNDSGDGSAEKIRTRYPDIRLIELPKNAGFGAGNNRGVEKASGKFLALINSDCEVAEESFGPALEYIQRNPGVGIIGLRTFKPSGEIEQSARGFPDPSTGLFGRSTFLGKLAQKGKGGLGKSSLAKKNLLVDPSKTEPYDVDWVAGTMMLISRECWDAVNGFDEGFFMYWEDADICCRAKEKGFRTVYFPGGRIIHKAGSSASSNPSRSIRFFHQSAYRYVAKHISPGFTPLRVFAWTALNLRATLLIVKAGAAKSGKGPKAS